MNTRRQILKLLGMAPAAATGGAGQLAAFVASPAALAAASAGALAAPATAPSQYGILGPLIGKQLRKLQRATEDEMWSYRNARESGLDADIACLRSVSRVYKTRRQIERDLETSAILQHANTMLWGEQ